MANHMCLKVVPLYQFIELGTLLSSLLLPDKYTQLNSALFGLNGCTGYVLQPEVMRSDGFDPLQEKNKLKYIIDVRVRVVIKCLGGAPWCPPADPSVCPADYCCQTPPQAWPQHRQPVCGGGAVWTHGGEV